MSEFRTADFKSANYFRFRQGNPSTSVEGGVSLVKSSHARSDASYGSPRIWEDLLEAGERVSRKRVARLMREQGIVGVSRRRGVRTTVRGSEEYAASDLVRRNFTATRS